MNPGMTSHSQERITSSGHANCKPDPHFQPPQRRLKNKQTAKKNK